MIYLVYKTTNKINNKIYIGYHSTLDIDDDYLGSGKLLKESIIKYGIDNFKKEILFVFDNKNDALSKETELVNLEFINREDTYNLKIGGAGGWDHTHNNLEFKNKRLDSIKKSFDTGKSKGWQLSYEQRSLLSSGRLHNEETKIKISKSLELNIDIKTKRINDFIEIEKTSGYINKLSLKWEVSHTQVRRFLIKNNLILRD
jgi:hypothetical protein